MTSMLANTRTHTLAPCQRGVEVVVCDWLVIQAANWRSFSFLVKSSGSRRVAQDCRLECQRIGRKLQDITTYAIFYLTKRMNPHHIQSYVGILRFVCLVWWLMIIMFSNFYYLDLNKGTYVALVNLWWSVNNDRIENRISHDLDMTFGYISSPNCVQCWVWSSSSILKT